MTDTHTTTHTKACKHSCRNTYVHACMHTHFSCNKQAVFPKEDGSDYVTAESLTNTHTHTHTHTEAAGTVCMIRAVK